ncbi:energy transducer TonB [Coralliovum pocilloporae]|uniref:energy transducer TonB n=1 Tax=Coralliovum pocilloporae TaxID=3066369 RepID=UPI003306D12D
MKPRWSTVFAFSLAAHTVLAGAVLYEHSGIEEERAVGAVTFEVGESSFNAQASEAIPEETVQAEEPPVNEVTAREPRTTLPPVEAWQTVNETRPVQVARAIATTKAVTVPIAQQIIPIRSEAQPSRPVEQVAAAGETEQADSAKPTEATRIQESKATDRSAEAVRPQEIVETVTPAEVKASEPVPAASLSPQEPLSEVTETEAEIVPTPTARPRVTPPVKKTQVAETKQKKPKKKTAKSKTSRKQKKTSIARTRGGAGGRQSEAAGKAARSNYLGKVVAKLRRAKRYPRAAKRKRISGTAVLKLVIARNGTVSSARLTRSSGQPLLDQAVMAMVKRARKFPVFPDSMKQAQVTLTLPIDFKLR